MSLLHWFRLSDISTAEAISLATRITSCLECQRFGETTALYSTPSVGSGIMARACLSAPSVCREAIHPDLMRPKLNAPFHIVIEYHSWNAGPRSCLGRALATYEGLSIAAAIVQRFDVQLTEPDKTFESLPALNMVCLLASCRDFPN